MRGAAANGRGHRALVPGAGALITNECSINGCLIRARELTVQNTWKISCRLAMVAGLCALALSVTSHDPAAAAQGAAVAAVNPKPDISPQPENATRPATRRTTADKPAMRYFIEFRSRTALSYGHAYVVYGRLDAKGNMINPQIGAIHPASTSSVPYMLGHFVPVPAEHGATDGDLEDQYVSARYRIIVSEAQYNDVVAYIKELEASTPVWHAFLYSCITFVGNVARHMGLRTPPATWYPEVFINNLRAMNDGRDEEITFIPRVQWGLAPAAPPEE
jgi:hypothetical protein